VRPKSAAAIFERYHVGVFRYFGRMTGRHDLAQDLTQEVFLRVVRGLEAYQEQGLETAWVYRIARNVYLDHRRGANAVPPTIHDVEEVSADCQNIAAFGLREALALLPEREREAFVLREIDGLSYPEIAAACEVTEASVCGMLCRARLQLRTLLSRRLSQAPSIQTRNGKI
jgi:RNA polymerase sigma-70 factor, ECF subfamily